MDDKHNDRAAQPIADEALDAAAGGNGGGPRVKVFDGSTVTGTSHTSGANNLRQLGTAATPGDGSV